MSRDKHQTDDLRLVASPRSERIAFLRKQIADGTYRVNDRSVAAAMVRHGWDMLIGRTKPQG